MENILAGVRRLIGVSQAHMATLQRSWEFAKLRNGHLWHEMTTVPSAGENAEAISDAMIRLGTHGRVWESHMSDVGFSIPLLDQVHTILDHLAGGGGLTPSLLKPEWCVSPRQVGGYESMSTLWAFRSGMTPTMRERFDRSLSFLRQPGAGVYLGCELDGSFTCYPVHTPMALQGVSIA